MCTVHAKPLRHSGQLAHLQLVVLTGSKIVVEEFLEGEEASFFALLDGHTCLALASAQVHFAVLLMHWSMADYFACLHASVQATGRRAYSYASHSAYSSASLTATSVATELAWTLLGRCKA